MPVGVPKTGFPTEIQAHAAATNITAQIRGEPPTKRKSFSDIPAGCVMDAGNNGVMILADKAHLRAERPGTPQLVGLVGVLEGGPLLDRQLPRRHPRAGDPEPWLAPPAARPVGAERLRVLINLAWQDRATASIERIGPRSDQAATSM